MHSPPSDAIYPETGLVTPIYYDAHERLCAASAGGRIGKRQKNRLLMRLKAVEDA